MQRNNFEPARWRHRLLLKNNQKYQIDFLKYSRQALKFFFFFENFYFPSHNNKFKYTKSVFQDTELYLPSSKYHRQLSMKNSSVTSQCSCVFVASVSTTPLPRPRRRQHRHVPSWLLFSVCVQSCRSWRLQRNLVYQPYCFWFVGRERGEIYSK